MRIKTVRLSWFRGAADPVSLDLDCKSMVVYGVNGSGKSSFVDAIEYALNDGKIGHLAHEYSGKRQEKAIPNTHVSKGQKTELTIKFKDDSELKTEIKQDGSSTTSCTEAIAMRTWDYRRTVLRQDEVAAFIHDTKGDKYSALLPLLGLHKIEVAAENLRQLAKSVEVQSKLKETKVTLNEVKAKRKETFGEDSNDQILKKIQKLHATYCTDNSATEEALSRCEEIKKILNTRISESSTDQRRYVVLQSVAKLQLKAQINVVRSARAKLDSEVDPLITEKLEVLAPTDAFLSKLGNANEVECPACGRTIPVDAFQAHIKSEQHRLKDIINIFDTRKAAIGTMCDTIKSLKTNLSTPDVKSWRDELTKGNLADNFAYLDRVNTEALRLTCGEDDLKAFEGTLLPLIDAAATASKDAPLEAQQLSTDKQMVADGKAVIAAIEQTSAAARAETLVDFIRALERGIREEIRLRSQKVIDEISSDMQVMWATLHPDDAVEKVRLYLPSAADKAIDIGLKFHGVEQDSPRLTLSEGYRNSLGLSIFLAMAKREAGFDRPLFLDDVVVSLDRNHRGMIIELLEKDFSGRQVVILTHDREWYTELRQQLDGKNWGFKALLPYKSPSIGIRWANDTTTFGDARAHLKERPDSAGNDARKIMDVELALIAERLRIKLPYLRADKNDKRMAHDFLERIVADGKRCFQKKTSADYEVHKEAIETLDLADRLMISWANRASHTYDLVPPEASKLIDTCEKALGVFKCSSCGKGVWFADVVGSALVQCQCGQIRWKYGKS